ncbi:MerR family transcriptional regulator [Secundilactobacillus folii]|uniref:MerR family transcriptional regulator n=1 Tax=Secundilactobacillus folii TaxID=2678357 RepID=A0A7X2XVY4_9LACO|nr:MerR family transcriptional regulator [Secundilactobacillus folii]
MDNTYTIKDVAERFNLPISTIRYYDKQGLLPFVAKNQAGYREFTTADLHLIRTIVCLRNTEMPLRDIRQYINYCMAGPKSIPLRKALLQSHKSRVLKKQAKIMHDLQEIDYKLDRYNAPDAAAFVSAELQFASNEKRAHGLRDTFS